jgi:hypothetical protein
VVDALVDTIRVDGPNPMSAGIVNAPEAPVGKPVTLRLMLPSKAPIEVPEILKENEEPGELAGGVLVKDRAKSGATNLNWDAVKAWV